MQLARLFGGGLALAVLGAAAVAAVRLPARGIDYQDAPATVANPAADISDTYLFPSPTNPNNLVAVMDVDAGLPAGQSANDFFAQGVLYTMKFDNRYSAEATNARPVEDIVLQFSFGAPGNGTQQVLVYGPVAPNQTGTTTTLVDSGNASALGFIGRPFSFNGITVFAGPRADPEFFDLSQFRAIFPDRNQGSTAPSCLPTVGNGTCPQGFNNPGTDFFGKSNVLAIVVEMPKSTLLSTGSGSVVAYW
ncbi:MAG: DUF4331 family protein, partial [Vulcanimicrobiaceae bacterium]